MYIIALIPLNIHIIDVVLHKIDAFYVGMIDVYLDAIGAFLPMIDIFLPMVGRCLSTSYRFHLPASNCYQSINIRCHSSHM